jgi:3,4-dihydroxy 2-butanone 4-phosphate synthase/GTP cyclohydrolase II
MIESAGRGVVVYLRQEGRGIGLVNKLKAYALQDMGLDTVEANEHLGFPADLRNYGMGAQILMDLGVRQMRLITNNPRKIAGLGGYGLEVVERVPLLIEATSYNIGYLATKAQKLGHWMLQTYLVTIALYWQDPLSSPPERYVRLEKVRDLVQSHDLLLQEEMRPVAAAVFDGSAMVFHLGLEQPLLGAPNWYEQPQHPYTEAISQILNELVTIPGLQHIEFIVSGGTDPLTGLQVQLDRKPAILGDLANTFKQLWQPQTIYSLSTPDRSTETT